MQKGLIFQYIIIHSTINNNMRSKLEPFFEEIKNRYLNGETSKEISKDYNVYPGPIIDFLRKKGVSIRGNHQRKGNNSWNKGKIVPMEQKVKHSQNIFNSKKYLLFKEQTLRSHAKRILLYTNGNICSICGVTTWNNKPVPLVCDHIDGNSNNNNFKNFRLVCCNCDAQLPTYKSKNRGKGRAYDRQYYNKKFNG
jgi:hypothetical protein